MIFSFSNCVKWATFTWCAHNVRVKNRISFRVCALCGVEKQVQIQVVANPIRLTKARDCCWKEKSTRKLPTFRWDFGVEQWQEKCPRACWNK